MGDVLNGLYGMLLERKERMPEGSYTASLLAEGRGKIASKFIEEAGEVVAASLGEGHDRIVYETADLLYHLLVLLANEDVTLEEIARELESRRK
ncbi:MAG: phosphoribosyl-ATP diphosphatase [Actinobacteria bacterium]|nr:MAG: phosphoribosyl-ATP diphosphatase [Actinomycetota bacterium]